MPSLLLTAGDAGWSPTEIDLLTEPLARHGLIGDQTSAGNSYWPGDAFLELVMFLGCSPQVALNPQQAAEGHSVPSIHFHIYPETRFLAAERRSAARCRKCRATVEAGQAIGWDEDVCCPECGDQAKGVELDWRQSAGYGRCFVEIQGIYAQEAVPADKLLSILSACSGDDWRYFYT